MAWLWMLAANIIAGLSLVNDVKIFGINENVIFYLGAEIPVWATVNEEASNKSIEWVLNFPDLVQVDSIGNEAVLKPKSEGGVNIMARATDGSDSSRSIYALIQNYQTSSSSFSLTPGIKPIMESGINDKILQVEVDSNLSENDQIIALKNYLNQISQQGEITIQNKESWSTYYTLYHLKIAGYPHLTIQIRLDKRYPTIYDQFVWILENSSYLDVPPVVEDQTDPDKESSQNEIVPPSEDTNKQESLPTENDVVDEQPEIPLVKPDEPIKEEDVTLNPESITEEGSSLKDLDNSNKNLADLFEGFEGEGTKDSPYQLTLANLHENRRLFGLVQEAILTGKSVLYQILEGDTWLKYGLQILVEEAGVANEFYIELVVSKEEQEEISPLVEMIMEQKNEMTIQASTNELSPKMSILKEPTLLEIEEALSKGVEKQDFNKQYFVAGVACSSLAFSLVLLRKKI